MKQLITVLTLFLFYSTVQAQHHHAHVHGEGDLNIAVEGRTINLLLTSPADTFYGFERKPRTKEERALMQKAREVLQTEGSAFFQAPETLECTIERGKFDDHHDHHSHGTHQDVTVEWKMKCKKEFKGNDLSIDIGSKFPRIEKLRVVVVSNEKQFKTEFKNGKGKVRIE